MNIRTSILYISSSLIFLTNINTGSHHTHGDDMQTPQRDTLQKGQARHTVAQTPGQIVSQKQPGVFNYARLKSVLGMPFVNAAKLQCVGKDEDELEVNWNKIFNPLTPHNEKTKLQAIRKIPTLLLHYTGERDTLYLVLSDEVSRLNTETKQVPLTRIEESSKEHFEQRFPRSTVTTSAKRGGDQLGCIAEVTLADTQVLKYYVKTHSEGLKSGHSSAAKLVNPAELLVYKVLENIEIGPQSHFFGRDGENLYIATLDAGIQANIEGTFTQVPFYEYSYFKETEKPAVQEHLWGTLSQIPTDSQLSDTQHQKIEEKVASSLSAQNFISEVTKLDLVARIMELGDFQTNPGNYGFVFSESPPPQAMAIDFRIVNLFRKLNLRLNMSCKF